MKLQYLKKIWARMSTDEEERASMNNILDLYFERVEKREENL